MIHRTLNEYIKDGLASDENTIVAGAHPFMPSPQTTITFPGDTVNYTTVRLEDITVKDARISQTIFQPKMETDPHGKDLHAPGAKADAGKIRPGLVLGDFARALVEVSKIGTGGAAKYTEHGWISVPSGMSRYNDAALRHWLRYESGELLDPDTGLSHLAHLAWNCLARLDLLIREQEKREDVHSRTIELS